MFIVTISCNRRKWAALAGATLVVCGILTGAYIQTTEGTLAVAAEISPKGVNTNEERVTYLGQYGWVVEEEPVLVEEILIPTEMDDSYAPYLALQEEQGFDLATYAGERVKRYTYEVTNYTTGEQGVQAGLLVHGSQVVGGEIYSTEQNGFLHGLMMEE